MAKYSPTSVRLPEPILNFLDQESVRLSWSRNKVLEYYLIEGIKKGERPEALEEVLKSAD